MKDEPIDPKERYERSEKGKERNKQYRKKNKEKIKEYRKQWYADKMASDPAFAEKERERVREAAARYYQRKRSNIE